MKNLLKRGASFLLAGLMMTTYSSAFASETNLELIAAQPQFYQGVTYEITSKVANLPAEQLLEDTTSAFNWEITGVSTIVSSNNYFYTKNVGENTYTVSETAKFTINDPVGSNVTISSTYNNSNITSNKTFEVLQPITNISLESKNNEHSDYVQASDGSDDRLYVDMNHNTEFQVNCYPLNNDDEYTISATKSCSIERNTDNGTLTFKPGTSTKVADFNFDLKFTPASGYKYQKTIKVTKCVPLTKFSINAGGEDMISYNSSSDDPVYYYAGCTQDENFVITPKKVSPSYSNDTFDYKLYSYNAGELSYSSELDKYLTVDNTNKCILNIHNPGTYCLVTTNRSAGSGTLERTLKVNTIITVTESNPATKITSIEKDIDLYLNAGKDTYEMSDNISVEPVGHTDNIIYMSDDPSVAKIDRATGLITAVSSGSTKVYAISEKNPSVVAASNVNVFVGVRSIEDIQKELSTLPAGHSELLTLVTNPAQHDEIISWTSLNPEVLTVTQNGYVTANPDYNFGANDNIIVGITATSQFGKTYTTYIQVVPAVRADKVQINVTGSNIEQLSGTTYSCFANSTFRVSAEATGISGNKSNDVLLWKVATTSGSFKNLENATDIFSSIIKNSDGSYTVTPKISDTLTFYCYATKNGEGIGSNCVYSTAGVKIIAKATKLNAVNPTTGSSISSITVSADTTTILNVSMAPLSAYDDDGFVCSSDNDEICKVVKISPQEFKLITGKVYGTSTVTLQSKSGSKSATLKVTVNGNIRSALMSDFKDQYVYTGSRIEPNPVVTCNGKILYKGIDYTLSYSNQTDVGVAKMIITGKGDYAGSIDEKYYNITPKNIGDGKPSENISCVLSGTYSVATTNTPVAKFKVKYGSVTLKEGVDYQVICTNNSKAGVANAKIEGMGNYSGYINKKYDISDSIVNADVAPIANQVYDGKSKTPKVKVTYKGTLLTEGVDYTVTYSSNINVGFATAKITGINHFTSSMSVRFKIVPKTVTGLKISYVTANTIKLSWNKNTSYSYQGYQIINTSTNKVVATIKNRNTNTYQVSGLAYAAKYSFAIRAYAVSNSTSLYGPTSIAVSTYTKPAMVSFSKLSSGKGSIKATWKKLNSRITGYQIQYSTNSSFKSSKIVATTSYKSTSKTINKLSKNKKYYVRVRAYKDVKINNKLTRIYGSWSKTLSTKTK